MSTQFGLRTLLGSVAILCIAFAIIGPRYRLSLEQQSAIEELAREGFDCRVSGGRVVFVRQVRNRDRPLKLAALRSLPDVGVIWIDSSAVTATELSVLAEMPHLREVNIVHARIDSEIVDVLEKSHITTVGLHSYMDDDVCNRLLRVFPKQVETLSRGAIVTGTLERSLSRGRPE